MKPWMKRLIDSLGTQTQAKDETMEEDVSSAVKGMNRAETLAWAKARSGKLQRRIEVNFEPEVFIYQDGELRMYADTSRIDL